MTFGYVYMGWFEVKEKRKSVGSLLLFLYGEIWWKCIQILMLRIGGGINIFKMIWYYGEKKYWTQITN